MNRYYIPDLLVEFSYNIVLFLLSPVTYSIFRPSIKQLPLQGQPVVEGIGFGLGALAVMMTPILLAPLLSFEG